MRPYVVGAAVLVVSAAIAFVFWRERHAMLSARREVASCRLEHGAVYGFVGVGDRFLTAVVDVAHPTATCVDRRLPRDGRDVGVRGSDGALLYLANGRVFEAKPEKGTWSELHHAVTYASTSPPDPEIEAPACPGKVEGFLTDPESERVVYWCAGGGAIHDTSGKDLALDPKTERPLAVGRRGRVLAVRDRGATALLVVDPIGTKNVVRGVEIRFTRARVPVRAIDNGFLVLVPRGLGQAHDMFRVDFDGRATRDQRYEDLPEADVGTLDVVIDADASLFIHTQVTNDGAEAVVRLPPKNAPAVIVFRPTADQRFASSSLFTAP
jgi:hypothetical protein